MLRPKFIPVLITAAVLFCSCGPSKELQSANDRVDVLTTQNAKLITANEDLQKQISSLTASNQSVNAEYSKYRTDCEASKQKLEAMQAYIRDINKTLEEVERKLEAAVADFRDKGVEVYAKDGLVYINMQDKLMYKSGSAVMSEDGKKALGAVAAALNEYPKLKVYVVGNTDDRKFKNSKMDNLSLSTERANGVVRTLVTDHQVDPLRITSAGKGKYAPIADNATEEGRSKNRRTEIILNPDLVKLWENARNSN